LEGAGSVALFGPVIEKLPPLFSIPSLERTVSFRNLSHAFG
jgi:hypothetical protein